MFSSTFSDGKRSMRPFTGVTTLKKLPSFTAGEVSLLLQLMPSVLQTGACKVGGRTSVILSPNKTQVCIYFLKPIMLMHLSPSPFC